MNGMYRSDRFDKSEQKGGVYTAEKPVAFARSGDSEFGFFQILSVLILLAAFFWPFLSPLLEHERSSGAGVYSICIFYNITSLPCPGCGLTRALIYALRLDILASLTHHPLGLAALPWVLFFATATFSRLPRNLYSNHRKVFLSLLLAGGIVLLVFGVIRLSWIILDPPGARPYFFPFMK